MERFQQTEKKWLAAQPPAKTIAALQRQLSRFRRYYNQVLCLLASGADKVTSTGMPSATSRSRGYVASSLFERWRALA